MPKIIMHGLAVRAPGEALRDHDKQIAALGVELLEKLETNQEFGSINATIGFMETLLQRRVAILNKLRKDAMTLGTSPSKIYKEAYQNTGRELE